MEYLSAVLLTLACVSVTLAYPSGPPTSACVDMYPVEHKADAETSSPPYTITTSAANYRSNVTVTLTAMNSGYFEGVFIQARRAKCDGTSHDEAVGTYWLNNYNATQRLKTLDCSGQQNALSHKDKVKKTVLWFVWVPPPQDVGTVYFRGTFVKEIDEFWTTVSSDFLIDRQSTADSPKKCSVRQTLSAGNNVSAHAYVILSACAVLSIFISDFGL